jgi:hypothetical protein
MGTRIENLEKEHDTNTYIYGDELYIARSRSSWSGQAVKLTCMA